MTTLQEDFNNLLRAVKKSTLYRRHDIKCHIYQYDYVDLNRATRLELCSCGHERVRRLINIYLDIEDPLEPLADGKFKDFR